MNKSENIVLVTVGNWINHLEGLFNLKLDFRRNFQILLGTLAGGGLGVVISLSLQTEWEAKALVRVGQLASTQIVPSLSVLEQINTQSFQRDVIESLGGGANEDKVRLFEKSLKARLENSGLVTLSVRGNSPEEARLNMVAVIEQIKSAHSGLFIPAIKRLQREIQLLNVELKSARYETENLKSILNKQRNLINERNFNQTALLNSTLAIREKDLIHMSEYKFLLEERVSPERTFETNSLGGVGVLKTPVFPKKLPFALAGSIVGLMLGVLMVLLRSRPVERGVDDAVS